MPAHPARRFGGALLAGLVAGLVLVDGQGLRAADALEQARFRVLDRVVAPDLPPFSANMNYAGNGADLTGSGSGFEPILYRTRMTAQQDAPDRVIAGAIEISNWDTLQTGALDGAEVDILRIENGALRLVRQATVPPGGHQASGWTDLLDTKILAAGSVRYSHAWPGWTRPSARYYLTVRAVDSSGRLSPPGATVEVTSPERTTAAPLPNDLVDPPRPIDLSQPADLAAPADLKGRVTHDGILTLTWTGAPRGVAGYKVYMSDLPPERHRGYSLLLSGEGPPVRKGDMVILRKRSMVASRRIMATNRIWNTGEVEVFRNSLVRGYSDEPEGGLWELKRHAPDTPVTDPGDTYLSLTYREGDGALIGSYNHSGTGQSWYPILDPARTYRFEVWMRGRAYRPALFQFQGPFGEGGPTPIPTVRLPIKPEWTKYTVEFRPPALLTGDAPGRIVLAFEGAGLVEIDNFRIYPTDAPFLGLPVEDVARLRNFDIDLLRTHGLIKTGRRSYDLAQLTNGPGGNGATAGGQTLGGLLTIFEGLGADPWVQVEPHLSPEEWLGLVEYLAAPVDPAGGTPWAERRARAGHPAPWTDSFGRILFELGNETWNTIFHPWTFGDMPDAATGQVVPRGEVYGLFQEYVLSILRQSPYWPQLRDRLVLTVGGWSISDYGAQAAAASPATDLMTVATYNGGWDEGEGPVRPNAASFHSVLNAVNQTTIPRARQHMAWAEAIGAARGRPLAVGTYEAGPGYALNGLNSASVTPEEAALQEQVMKSLAAGTATLDSFLAQARLGYRIQSFFGYGEGTYWTSHAKRSLGGQSYPSWDLLGLFNRIGTGDMLDVDTQAVPTLDLPQADQRQAVPDAPQIGVYATRKGDRLTVFVLSRRVPDFPRAGDDGRTAVTVDLPIAGAAALTRVSMTGGYAAHNVSSREVEFQVDPLPLPADASVLQIPVLEPGETLTFVYEGVR